MCIMYFYICDHHAVCVCVHAFVYVSSYFNKILYEYYATEDPHNPNNFYDQ
jgi:hypothetical protein